MIQAAPWRQGSCVSIRAVTIRLVVLAGWAVAGQVRPAAGAGLHWPDEWVVFGPLARNYAPVAQKALQTLPDRLILPETGPLPTLSLEPQRVTVVPGETIDLAAILGEERVGTTAYVYMPLQAETAATVTLGLGGDWWLESWLNGKPLYNTLDAGNDAFPPSVIDHPVEATLREGANLLVVRFSRGAASALLAAGDESHFAAAEARQAARRRRRALNTLPETLVGRLLFPVDTQATATANQMIDWSLPEVDLAAGALVGLQPMPGRQVYLNMPEGQRAEIRDTETPRFDEPVRLLLSKSRYPFEDRHLDAIVWTTPPDERLPEGHLEVLLVDADGGEPIRHVIDNVSATGWFFSLGFPERLAGREAALEIVWRNDGQEVGRARARFQVQAPKGTADAGRVPVRLLNAPGATLRNAPMTVGVPFPRGALLEGNRIRLVDETGAAVALQTRVSARWSRFGYVKWLLCDFTADLDGAPREWFLEFGPELEPLPGADTGITVTQRPDAVPAVDAGRLRMDEWGVAYDVSGAGDYRLVLGPGALSGAFVSHEDGRLFAMPADADWAIEEHGPEKIVLRRTGWYVAAPGPSRFPPQTPENPHLSSSAFCQFVTRFVMHRDSPVIRIFHTWIFTGDGNRDRIADMGWRFETTSVPTDGAFLLSHERPGWIEGGNLVQFDHQTFSRAVAGTEAAGRTPGVLTATIGDVRVFFGAKDFWQNFPSELEIDAGGFTFYNWPRHNPPATFERPVPRDKAFLHRFAHEGEVLDFRLPDEYAEGDIWQEACGRERHWAQGRPETANAQGIARTEEMFLYLAGPDAGREAAARVMRGFNDESLRAVADPAWTAASGVFGAIHPRDPEAYPEDEQIYEQVVLAPGRWNERLGFYGMWLHGDVPAWGINLHDKTVSLYRAIRKNHHGWPVAWIPYARSGDPRLLKPAEAATRQMIDANFCHYADAVVDASVGPDYFRRQGWWDRSLLPWAARSGPHLRSYTVDCDYLWHAYYLTGYARARDVALLFGKLTQHDHGAPRGPRTTSSMLPAYLDLYQATYDPWFLAAVHAMAKLHLTLYPREAALENMTHESPGHFWRPADESFHRFTGDDAYRLLALNHSVGYSSPRSYGFGGLWPRLSVPYISQAVYAWTLTGDTFHLDRADAYLDWARRGVYDGSLVYGRGSISQGGTARGIFTGYYIRQFPLALGAFEKAGYRPVTIPNPFFVAGDRLPADDPDRYHFQLPEVIVRKNGPQRIDLSLAARHRDAHQAYDYEITGPDGNRYREGQWLLDFQPRTIDIAPDAPDGAYRVRLGGRVPLSGSAADRARTMRRHGDILLPLARPGVPEVMVFERTPEGTRVASGVPATAYWFQVPEGVSAFWIDFPGAGGDFNRASVWDPDGRRVWDRSYAFTAPGRTRITVLPGQTGRLWRASGAAFVIDPQIPPYFSISATQWFLPES